MSGRPRARIVAKSQEGIDIVPVDVVEQTATDGGLPQDQARAVADDYGDAQLDALRLSLGRWRWRRSCR
jgi:protein-disulfide isomerase-like protein with CxxC motif